MDTIKEIIPLPDNKGRLHHVIIRNLLYKYKPKNIAEIGVHRGRGMRAILREKGLIPYIEQYFAIDPWKVYSEAGMESGEVSWNLSQKDWDYLHLNVCKYTPWFPALKIMRLKSIEASKLFQDGYFDFVYIDGDHSYQSVKEDILAWLPKVKKGGIIAGHDYKEKIGINNEVNRVIDELFGKDVVLERCSVWYKEII